MSKKTGVELIADERKRQIEVEGYTAEHDSCHNETEPQLVLAAVAYLTPKEDYEETYVDEFDDDDSRAEKEANPVLKNPHWPWEDEGFRRNYPVDGSHPFSPTVKDLVKAGALIAAEIDRLQQ